MGGVTYQVSSAGATSLALECKRLDGNTAADVSLGFNNANSTASVLNINVDCVVPTKPKGEGGVSLGKSTDTFTNIFTDGVTIADDGVGTVKLLAREFTNNTVSSAYVGISGSSLYAVSIRTADVDASSNLVTATPTVLIDKSSPQSGTWVPLQYQSGSWRSGGNYIISLYRRIL
jgi:hypothetical protein